jgi:hypothetical protein
VAHAGGPDAAVPDAGALLAGAGVPEAGGEPAVAAGPPGELAVLPASPHAVTSTTMPPAAAAVITRRAARADGVICAPFPQQGCCPGGDDGCDYDS